MMVIKYSANKPSYASLLSMLRECQEINIFVFKYYLCRYCSSIILFVCSIIFWDKWCFENFEIKYGCLFYYNFAISSFRLAALLDKLHSISAGKVLNTII